MFFLPAIIAAIGLGLSAVGTVTTMNAQKQAAAASKRAEELRKRQMNLDSQRQKRQMLREGMIARSMAVSNANAQGAQSGSGLQGGLAQVSNATGANLLFNRQSTQIGAGIFDANAARAQAEGRAAVGQAITGFGGMITANSDRFSRVGQQAFGA